MKTAKSCTPGVLIISVYDIDTAQQGLFAHFFVTNSVSVLLFFWPMLVKLTSHSDFSLFLLVLGQKECLYFPLTILPCLTNHYRIMIILFTKEVLFGLGPWSLKQKRWLISCSWMTGRSSWSRRPPRWNQIGVLY